VLTYVFGIIVAAGVLAALSYCLAAGARNGDRPGDALVTALLTQGARPDEARPLIVVTVRNPSGTPVFAGLTARAAVLPAGLAGVHDVSVPWRTLRGKFRPGQYAVIGVAPAGGAAEFGVPVPARSRRYVLTVAVGQEAGRLRVHRLRLGAGGHAATGRRELFSSAPRP
jgi:hypothetical protein